MPEESLAARFLALFAGSRRSHGTYEAEDVRADGPKHEIKRTARTLRSPATEALWAEHLAGKRPLGIVPIDDDGTCRWGAVDVDVYDLTHVDLVRTLAQRRIPAVVCRTKSGGAHIFLFFSEAIPAAIVMPRLRELAALLGHGDAEVFPKQERVAYDRGDLGSWLNMPYYRGDETSRFAVTPDGMGAAPATFLDHAWSLRISAPELAALPLRPVPTGDDAFRSGPPCLEILVSKGFGEGTRNAGLFALGVLAKKISPDGWEALLDRWNQQHLSPPLPAEETSGVVRSLRRKEYTYRCRDQPLVGHCNQALCRTRPHGIGMSGGVPILEAASVLGSDPPLFFVTLKTGGVLEVDARVLLSPQEFQLAALRQLQIVLPMYKREDWMRAVARLMEKAARIEAPAEVGVAGRFAELLEQFCTDRHRAETRDEIVLGKPWLDDDAGRVYFRLRDLERALQTAKFQDYTRGQVVTRIREMGGDSSQFATKGRNTRVWWIPSRSIQWQTQAHDLPRAEDQPI